VIGSGKVYLQRWEEDGGRGGALVIELTKKCLLTEIQAERRTNGSSGGQE